MALLELRVSDVGVIHEARVAFGDGFTVLTGETGAGKSLCINALRVALGGRCEVDSIRRDATSATVSAVFDGVGDDVDELLTGLGVARDELLTLTRVVVRGGRGSCRINGALVSIDALREVGESLVEVTWQGASARLLRSRWHREMLDAAAGARGTVARDAVRRAFAQWRAAADAISAARSAAALGGEALARARDTVAELAPLQLRAGEDVELERDASTLRHAARISEASLLIADSAAADDTGAADLLAQAVRHASGVVAVDPALRTLVDEADELTVRLRELALDARRHSGQTTVDAGRLGVIEERLDALARVQRRHGSLDAAIDELARAEETVAAADGGEGALGRLEGELRTAAAQLAAAASGLSAARQAAAVRLERAVTAELRQLEMPGARLRIVLSRMPDDAGIDLGDGHPVASSQHGVDRVELRLATAKDAVPMPLDQGPSGGELSRLALALSAVVVEDRAPALVLDEIDSGIGGETAARVGDVLAAIGTMRQVIAVTHRPEIASRAASHVLVRKQQAPGGSSATVRGVDGDDRVAEVARLMSGRVTPAALARAAELLADGSAVHEVARQAEAALPTI